MATAPQGDPDWAYLQTNFNWYRVLLNTPDGAEHELRPLGVSSFPGTRDYLKGHYSTIPGTNGSPMVYYSFDGSYIWAVVNPDNSNFPIRWQIYMPDGSKIVQRRNGIQRITDTNGNQVEIFGTEDSPGVFTTHFQDKGTGREVQMLLSNGMINQVRYQTVGGVWVNIDLEYEYTTVRGKTFQITDADGQGGTCLRTTVMPDSPINVLKSITLPETEPGQPKRQYLFSYNSDTTEAVSLSYQEFCGQPPQTVTLASRGLGSLNQISMPMGATINYSYALDSSHQLIMADSAPQETVISKTVVHDGTSDTWTYNVSEQIGVVSNPDGTSLSETKYPQSPGIPGYYGGIFGKAGLAYKSVTADRIIERHWISRVFSSGDGSSSGGLVTFNPVVDAEYTTLLNSAGQPSKMSAKTLQYDFNGNLTQQTDYDWFSPTAVQRDTEGVPMGVPTSATVLRTTVNSFYNPAPTSTSSNVYAKRTNTTPPLPLILNAIQETTIGPSRTQYSYDGLAFGTAPTTGNLTKESRWDDRANKWLDTIHTYDLSTGNRTSTRDPKGNLVSYFYTDATHALPNTVTVDPLNGTGQQSTHTVYDFSTGLVTSETDANGNVTTTDYTNLLLGTVDPYGRPGIVTGPPVTSTVDGVSHPNQQQKEVTRYYDSQRYVEVWTDLNLTNDAKLRTKTTQDSLGRTIRADSSEDGINYSISSTTAYQQMGRITFASNPKRTAGATTDGWTRTTRDNAGRVIEVASFSGAVQPPATGTNANWTGSVSTAYNAEVTTVTDQAGKSRRSIVDGLGRLKQVIEDPNGAGYVTTYGYDVLGSLTQVTQGVQTRTFTYDSLSRLREAYDPEQVNQSGIQIATSYQYDDASNLTRRDNPNGSFVSFGPYDGLNRVTQKTLSSGNTWVYSYDTGLNARGKVTSVVLQGSTDGCYYDGYDAEGRLNAGRQITITSAGSKTYSMSYGYNLAGGMTKEVYPSGKEVRTSYDSAGRVSQVSRYNASVFDKTYTSGFSYTAHGAVSAMNLAGALMSLQTTFNARLQPTKMDTRRVSTNELLLGLDYTFGTTANNGNIQTQAIRIGGTTTSTTTFNQSYGYDGLNRLSTATETGTWSQSYGYDQYGNRWVSGGFIPPQNVGLTPQTQSAFTAATNRLAASLYDTSGNQTQDGQGRQFTYDSENRQLTFNTSAASYSYDGDGRRVKKTDATGTTVFVYNAGGRLVAEYTAGAAQPNGTSYLTTDHLGSTRLVTDGSANVKSRHDYLPFGEEIPSTIGRASVSGYGASDTTRQRFTQKERDNESGLDYFLARYYSSAHGRFTSPDEFVGGPDELYYFAEDALDNPTFYANPINPQSLNKYQYAHNNPLRYVDMDGHGGIDGMLDTAGEFLGGVVRGAGASITFGTYPGAGPSKDDSLTSRIGQGVGTVIVGSISAGTFVAGGGAAVLSNGATTPVSVPAMVAGVVGAAGASLNAIKIATTPIHQAKAATGRAEAASGSEKVRIRHTDPASKLSLRRETLTTGGKKLRELGLKERITPRGRHEFFDPKTGRVRAAFDAANKKGGAHWHKLSPDGQPLNNKGKVVNSDEPKAHIRAN